MLGLIYDRVDIQMTLLKDPQNSVVEPAVSNSKSLHNGILAAINNILDYSHVGILWRFSLNQMIGIGKKHFNGL